MTRENRTTFDEVAELYHRVRPGYPGALVSDVLALADLAPGSRILEIGCGTGKATVLFAASGHPMLCLEPGDNLAAVARKTCADYPGVEIAPVRFEQFAEREKRELEREAFGLVISAQAFHWVALDDRCARVADALAPGGLLALFWNHPIPGKCPFRAAIDADYARCAPELAARAPGSRPGPNLPPEAEIEASGCFEKVTVRDYPWSADYAAADYADLMRTQSDHRMLPESQRDALLGAIVETVKRHGGTVRIEYVARLYTASKSL